MLESNLTSSHNISGCSIVVFRSIITKKKRPNDSSKVVMAKHVINHET